MISSDIFAFYRFSLIYERFLFNDLVIRNFGNFVKVVLEASF